MAGYTLAEQVRKRLDQGRITRIEEAKVSITDKMFNMAQIRYSNVFRIELDSINPFLSNSEVEQLGNFFTKEGFEVTYNYAYGNGPGSNYKFITLKIASGLEQEK